MSQTLQAIRGMNDILPADAELWEQFEETIRDWLRAYGYRPIRMPMVEPTGLFHRAIGEVTDIVNAGSAGKAPYPAADNGRDVDGDGFVDIHRVANGYRARLRRSGDRSGELPS